MSSLLMPPPSNWMSIETGPEKDSVVSVDNIVTIPVATLGRQIGFFLPDQEELQTTAIQHAFDLD